MVDPDRVREWCPAMDSKRDFNTAGPVHRDEHYCIPPLDRVNLAEVLALIRRKRCLVLHAPRQTGKTSALLALSDLLNSGTVGEYRCVYVNVEIAQTTWEDVGRAMRAVISWTIHRAQRTLGDDAVPARLAAIDPAGNPDGALVQFLSRWAAADPRPLVLLLDEIDAIVGDSLVSVLRQLRAGYAHRPGSFPQSVVLCGARDVRDYRIRTGWGRDVIAGEAPSMSRPSRSGWVTSARPRSRRSAGTRPRTPRRTSSMSGTSGRWRGDRICAARILSTAGSCPGC